MRLKWITDREIMNQIIDKCDSCALAMVDPNNLPYVVPMNFGMKGNRIYMHGDQHGRKMDCLRNNPNVFLSFSTDHEIFHQNEKVACSYSMAYKSVTIQGKVSFITDYQEKEDALRIIMGHYTDKEFSFNQPAVENVAVFYIEIDDMKSKEFGRFVS